MVVPKTLPTIHKYNVKEILPLPSEIIDQSWYGRLTKTNLFKTCALCDSSTNIEMHHLRKVKDVRAKIANKSASFGQWIGATQRKQIPLCQYHHSLYHAGKLLSYELAQIAKYNDNLSSYVAKDKE